MKLKVVLLTFMSLQVGLTSIVKAQLKAGPYVVKNSEEFKSPKKHFVSDPIPYGKDGIIQVNIKGLKSFSFQKFSNDLKLEKENITEVENKFNDRVSFQSMVKFKNKTYLFAREVFKEEEKEGITALEFSPKDLNFVGSAKNLFKSTDKVKMGGSFFTGFGAAAYNLGGGYDIILSEDETKFLYTYALVNKEKKDKLNKEVVGMQVFDENLVKQWGGDYEMPYTEAKMDNLGFLLTDDGTVYLLAKVYEGDTPKEGKDKKKPNYHFEILVYQKGQKASKNIQIKLDNYFPTEAMLYENENHDIAITGFYSKAINKPIDGAYMIKLDVEKGVFTKLKGGYYEIPSDVIKSFTSEREKRKMEKQESKDEDNDIGINNLKTREIYVMDDGSTKIVSEQYWVQIVYYYDMNCKCMKTRYDTYAEDIFVMSINADGKLDWVKKIPKSQHSASAYGPGISINTMKTGNDIHIFYIDNIKNLNLSLNEAPKRHEDGRGGFLTGVTVSNKGDIKKYSLGEIDDYKTNFYIRQFVDGERNNLISTERRKKKNILFSIEVK